MSMPRVLSMVAGSVMSLGLLSASLAQPGAAPAAPPGAPAGAGGGEREKPDFPPFKEVSEGYDKVVTGGEEQTLYTLWVRQKDGQVLAELPRNFGSQKHMFSMTVPTGELFAGLQSGEIYGSWKRFDKRVAFIAPNLSVRSTGDMESKDAIENHFTDRVVFDVPIVAMGPSGNPVIDLDALLVGQMDTFYGPIARGANARLATVKELKSFPNNFVVAFTVPTAGGTLRTFHYNVSLVPDNPSYKPREADNRVGYFYDSFRDLGKFKQDEVWVRYINRWHIEKADPKLRLSPPKQPIVYYVEHTVPVRYRRWVREGALAWNKAFEKIGITDAVEVYFQDKATGAHMDKDPEDTRYNFIRWLANDIGTAIGPSRSHPVTGQILDADVVLTDGWIRYFWYQANEFLPQQAMEGMSPETLAWLQTRPQWDPRVRLAPPEQRQQVMMELTQETADRMRRGVVGYGGMVPGMDPSLLTRPELRRLAGMLPADRLLCMAAEGKSRDMALAGVALEVMGMLGEEGMLDDKKDDKPGDKPGEKKDEKKDEGDRIDGIPEWFVGPMLADLTAHEVGHTLGLRHNFRASSIYTLAQINSKEFKEKGKPITGSVMDYNPVNINMQDGEVQGSWGMSGIGPYDMWAIEYGYTLEDPKKVLSRVAEPELTYGTDEDTGGPDPLARRYDLSADPRDYAQSRLKLAKYLRERIIEKFVKDGEVWAKARRGYQITLSTHMDAVNIMAGWLGGTFVNRDRKGDPGNRAPLTPVPAEQQRAALKFIIENSFFDEAFGLSPELLAKMTVDKWWDGGGNAAAEPTWPIHDRILGVQASVLTMVMNPTTLRRVYDNEVLKPADQDALTLPEVFDSVGKAIWQELDKAEGGSFTNRQPMISSLRRNLQREHVERLIDLSINGDFGAAGKPIQQIATAKLRELGDKVKGALDKGKGRFDAYTLAHLSEASLRIGKALDAQYTMNGGGMGGIPWFMLMGRETGEQAPAAAPQQGE